MPDTGAPWNIPYVAGTDLVSDWPTDSLAIANAVDAGLDTLRALGLGSNVVSAVKSDQFTTSSSTYVVPTGLTATITPSSASSKILVIATVHVSNSTATAESFVQLFRDSTEVHKSTGASTQDSSFYHISSAAYEITRGSIMYLDSPATTSATTYEPRVKCATGTVTINRGGTSTAAGAVSSIVLIEVAA